MPRPPRVYQTPAIVLRQRKLGDADKVITLYSASSGKIDVVAKGVRRTASKLAGHVEPLNHGSFMFAHGRNLDVLTQAQTIESFQPLRQDLDRLSRALYAAELIERCTEERAESFAIYRLLLDTLRRLANTDGDIDLALRFLEMALLGHLGYQPELDRCVMCGNAPDPSRAIWAPGVGGVLCGDCRPVDTTVRPLSPNGLKMLRLLQRGDARAVMAVNLDQDLMFELEAALREAFHYALDRDIKSAQFIDTVRRPRPVGSVPGNARN
jgi:DNA repair protein RecO (recombination protein O)